MNGSINKDLEDQMQGQLHISQLKTLALHEMKQSPAQITDMKSSFGKVKIKDRLSIPKPVLSQLYHMF